jgi:hypothetical protein
MGEIVPALAGELPLKGRRRARISLINYPAKVSATRFST